MICAACLSFGVLLPVDVTPADLGGLEPRPLPAVTVYNGNALCINHFEVGHSVGPLEQHHSGREVQP